MKSPLNQESLKGTPKTLNRNIENSPNRIPDN